MNTNEMLYMSILYTWQAKKKYFDRVFATPWRQSKLRQNTEGDLFIPSLTDRNASPWVSIILVNNIIHATTRVKEWHELVFNTNV